MFFLETYFLEDGILTNPPKRVSIGLLVKQERIILPSENRTVWKRILLYGCMAVAVIAAIAGFHIRFNSWLHQLHPQILLVTSVFLQQRLKPPKTVFFFPFFPSLDAGRRSEKRNASWGPGKKRWRRFAAKYEGYTLLTSYIAGIWTKYCYYYCHSCSYYYIHLYSH